MLSEAIYHQMASFDLKVRLLSYEAGVKALSGRTYLSSNSAIRVLIYLNEINRITFFKFYQILHFHLLPPPQSLNELGRDIVCLDS